LVQDVAQGGHISILRPGEKSVRCGLAGEKPLAMERDQFASDLPRWL
jgi:hypothetical protein